MELNSRKSLRTMLLGALLLTGSSTPVLAQKGGNKPAPPPPPVYPYKFTSLGQVGYNNIGGGAKAYGINEADQDNLVLVVGGGSSTPSPEYATLWQVTASGGLVSAAPLPDSIRATVAVNDAGMIAFCGYSDSQAANVGMVSVPGVGIVEYPWLGPYPQAINSLGEVVLSRGAPGVLWTVNNDGSTGNLEDLGDFVPFAISDLGLMAGQQGPTAAIGWFEDGALQVQTLPGLFTGNYGRATGVNNLGEVVGVSYSNGTPSGALSGYRKPFLWRPTAGLTGLASEGAALDINDHGQVVGWSITSNSYYAFLWENGKLSDLNALSGVGTKTFRLGSAESINNTGHIVGRSDSYNKNGTSAGSGSFLLTPK